MKRQPGTLDQRLERYLTRYKSIPEIETDLAETRILQRLHAETDTADFCTASGNDIARPQRSLKFGFVAAATLAALCLSLYLPTDLVRRVDAHAVVESGDGTALRVGERVEPGRIIRTNDAGAVLALADKSRVEVSARSQLLFEDAGDGVRVRLQRGGVIINAARQPHGQLYVQTRDMTVAVAGTVFLVHAEEEGSRVGVIEGEVRVQTGTTEAKLLPGEQVATSPLLGVRSLKEEIAWSERAGMHLALLQRSAPPAMAAAAQQLQFEVASIKAKPSARPEDIGPGGGGIDCAGIDGRFGSAAQGAALGRCSGRHVSLLWLIDAAYGLGGRAPGRISQTGFQAPRGMMQFEPWIGNLWEYGYQIDAKAENATTTTKEQLRQMLQAMLADRFKLRVRRETREVEALVMSVARGGIRLREVPAEDAVTSVQQIEGGVRHIRVRGNGRIGALIAALQPFSITDQTSLNAIYAFDVNFDVPIPLPREGGGGRGGGGAEAGPSPWQLALQNALQEQLGLRLTNEKTPTEFIIIDHVEKPTEN